MRTTTSSPSSSSRVMRGASRVGVVSVSLEQVLDVERRDAGAQARAQVDGGRLAQRDDGAPRGRRELGIMIASSPLESVV